MIKLLRFLSVAYDIKLSTKKITFSIQTLKFQKLPKITVTNKLEQYGTYPTCDLNFMYFNIGKLLSKLFQNQAP